MTTAKNLNTLQKTGTCSRRRAWVVGYLLLTFYVSAASSQEPTLRLYTEDFPPYSMVVDGAPSATSADQITGFATEIVRELLIRANADYTLHLVPWKRAYARALNNVNHGVFSTTRTEQREPLFQWVGPLAENNWVFMGREDSAIQLNSLAQAKGYRIGGYLEDAIAAYLEAQGLPIQYVPNDALNVRKLAKGRIDLWPVVQLKGRSLAQAEGVAVKEIFTIKRTVLALALNKDTDPALVARLNLLLGEMHVDGTVERITQPFLRASDTL